MRYLELLEDDAGEASSPSAEKVYFHVTTKPRLKSIQELGIKPGHNRRWKTGFGVKLGERGKIYLMSSFTAAVRWASKAEWEYYRGELPEKSPYIIVCVRENPDNLQLDPHPENGFSYGNTWFEKEGAIPPENIIKIIPLSPKLKKQVINGGTAVLEALTGHYNAERCVRELNSHGWFESHVPSEFRAPDYPEYSIDLDIHSIEGGPYAVYRGAHRLGVYRLPPYPQQLALRDKII